MMLRLIIFLSLFQFISACDNGGQKKKSIPDNDSVITSQNSQEPSTLYGFLVDSAYVFQSTIEKNDYLGKILSNQGLDYSVIEKLTSKAKGVFDVRKFQKGKKYSIIGLQDSTPQYFIYEPNKIDYIVFDFSNLDSLSVYKNQKEVLLKQRMVSGVIHSSLYKTLKEQGSDPNLAILLSEIYAWSIDFYRIQKEDAFKIFYTEKIVGDQSVGIGAIKYAQFTHNGEPFYAIYFEQDSIGDYFDEKANSLRKAFLKAPVKYSRISSRYSMKRFHPILKVNKAHLGTDYSAPYGTPIQSTGDGSVIEAGYKGGNGNYVKIRHNDTYTTQYLHMSKIGTGIRPGKRVKQGDVIGFVGSTGLATGPHVCYRFWKNGQQVDPLKEKIPPSEPVKPEYLEAFNVLRDSIIKSLR